MDPISIGLGVVGLGTSLFGMFSSSDNAKQQAQVSANIAATEGQENDVRKQAMEMSAQRAQLQTIRTQQRARAMAVQAGATQTGSLTGSGIQGGIAETSNEGYFGLQGINNNRDFSRQIFGYDKTISADKVQLSQLQGQAATDQGITSLGNSILKAGPIVSNIFGGFGKSSGSSSSGSGFNPFNVTGSLY